MAAPTQSDEHRYAIPVLYHPYHPRGPSSLPFQNGQQLCVADILNIVFSINENSYMTRTTPAIRQDMYNFICKSRSMRHFFRDAFWWIYLQHLSDKDLEVTLNQSIQNTLLSDADAALLSLDAVEDRVRKMAPKGSIASPVSSMRKKQTSSDEGIPRSPIASPNGMSASVGGRQTRAQLQRAKEAEVVANTHAHLFSHSLPAHLEVNVNAGNRRRADVIQVGCPRSNGNLSMLSATLDESGGGGGATAGEGEQHQRATATTADRKNEFYKVVGTRPINTGLFYGAPKKKRKDEGTDMEDAGEEEEDALAASIFQRSSASIAKKSRQRHVMLVGGLADSGSDSDEVEEETHSGVGRTNTAVDASQVTFTQQSQHEISEGEAAQQDAVVSSYMSEVNQRRKRQAGDGKKGGDKKRKKENKQRTSAEEEEKLASSPRSDSSSSSSRASSVDSVCSQRQYNPTAELELLHEATTVDCPSSTSSSIPPVSPESEVEDDAMLKEREEVRKQLIKRGYVNIARIPVAARHPIVAKEQHKLFTRMSLNYTRTLMSSITSHFSHYKLDEDDEEEEDIVGGGSQTLPPIHGSRKQSIQPGAHLGFTANQHRAVQRHKTRRPQHYILRDMISRFVPDLLAQGIYLAFVLALPFAVNTHLGGKFQESILHHLTFWLGGVEMNMRPVVGSMASLMVPPPGFTAPSVEHNTSASNNGGGSSSGSPVFSVRDKSGGVLSPNSFYSTLKKGGGGSSSSSTTTQHQQETSPSRLIISGVPGVATRDASQAALATESLAVSVSVSSWPIQNVVMLIRRRRRDQLTRLKQGIFAFESAGGDVSGKRRGNGGAGAGSNNWGGGSDSKQSGEGMSPLSSSPSSHNNSPTKSSSSYSTKATKKKTNKKSASIFDTFRHRHRHDPYFPEEITIESLNLRISTSKRDAKRRERNAARMREELDKMAKRRLNENLGNSIRQAMHLNTSSSKRLSMSSSSSPARPSPQHQSSASTSSPRFPTQSTRVTSPSSSPNRVVAAGGCFGGPSSIQQQQGCSSTTNIASQPISSHRTPQRPQKKPRIAGGVVVDLVVPAPPPLSTSTPPSAMVKSSSSRTFQSSGVYDRSASSVDLTLSPSRRVHFIRGDGGESDHQPPHTTAGSNSTLIQPVVQEGLLPTPVIFSPRRPPAQSASSTLTAPTTTNPSSSVTDVSGGGGNGDSPVVAVVAVVPRSRGGRHLLKLTPSDILQNGGGIVSPQTAGSITHQHPTSNVTRSRGTVTTTQSAGGLDDAVKRARTDRLVERQVLAFQREMGRLTNTHTFAAFHNFLSESEDVGYNAQNANHSSRTEGPSSSAVNLKDDRRVDNFLLGNLAAQQQQQQSSGGRRGSTASVKGGEGGGGGATNTKPPSGSKHSTSRNVQTIKSDLDERFLSEPPWWMKSGSRVRRPVRGHAAAGGGSASTNPSSAMEGGGSGGGGVLVGGFESSVGMLLPGTQTPSYAAMPPTGGGGVASSSPVIPVGLKFGLTNWSPLVHRYMLLFSIDNNTPATSITWTA